MTACSPNAFALSAALHGAVVAAVLLGAWATQKAVLDPPHIFELVAGAGDNFTATQAAAPEHSTAVKFSAPKQPRTPPTPKPEAATVPDAPQPTPTKPITKTTSAKSVTPVSVAKNNAPPTPNKNITKPSAAAQTKAPQINSANLANALTAHSSANQRGGAGGTALSREQSSELDAYFSLLKTRLREAHQKPDGVSDLLQADVEFRLNADGTIVNPRILVSSGNAAFDRSVVAAFRAMGALPPPPAGFRPDSYSLTFKMRDDH
jgi:colicin import membrane protein